MIAQKRDNMKKEMGFPISRDAQLEAASFWRFQEAFK